MRNVDPEIKAALESEEFRPFILVDITIGATTYRYTDCDVPIVWGGNLFSPRGMSFNGFSYSVGRVVDSVRFKIDNLDDQLTIPFLDADPQGSAVNIRLVVLDDNYQIISTSVDDSLLLFPGYIDEWKDSEGSIDMTLVSAMAQWNRRTLRLQSASCSWTVFKGAECQYAGPATKCNRSYARCVTLGNTANFGGERWLPSIESKEIVWGVRK